MSNGHCPLLLSANMKRTEEEFVPAACSSAQHASRSLCFQIFFSSITSILYLSISIFLSSSAHPTSHRPAQQVGAQSAAHQHWFTWISKKHFYQYEISSIKQKTLLQNWPKHYFWLDICPPVLEMVDKNVSVLYIKLTLVLPVKNVRTL